MLLGMCGKAGSGKDTIAGFISEHEHYDWKTYAFATPIKQSVNLIFGWDDRHAYGDLKEVVDPHFGVSPRVAYQTLGTEWGRNLINEDIWLLCAEQKLNESENLIITDVRFENEVDWIRDNGGRLIFVQRDGIKSVGINTHASELGMEHRMTGEDLSINNNASIEDTKEYVMNSKFINDWIYNNG